MHEFLKKVISKYCISKTSSKTLKTGWKFFMTWILIQSGLARVADFLQWRGKWIFPIHQTWKAVVCGMVHLFEILSASWKCLKFKVFPSGLNWCSKFSFGFSRLHTVVSWFVLSNCLTCVRNKSFSLNEFQKLHQVVNQIAISRRENIKWWGFVR